MLNICSFCSRRHSNILKYVSNSRLESASKFIVGFKTLQGHELRSRLPKSKKTKSTKKSNNDLESLVKPLPYSASLNKSNGIGAELGGSLDREKVLKHLFTFYQRKEVRIFAAENGLTTQFFHKAYLSFRKFCCDEESLPVELHILLTDICAGAGHVDDLMPYFLQHAKEIFPHLECMEDLKKISDLRNPANWYSEARSIERKIIFHAGPTNSGKTYSALQRFLKSKSGVYCGPLRLLATEVFNKCNNEGTPCDLITGEERRYANPSEEPANHVSCTVEMTSLNTPYEVAIIDEIQMIRDSQRGWAWTRSLLGLCAKEIHLCGEASAIDLVKELMMDTGDEVEVRKYKRYTDLVYLDKAVETFDNIRPGDCIVCFSKNDIYHINGELEKRGIQCAVIYGGLPPGTKLAQAAKFNDPNDPCKVMVATDAIGMGINLSIKRVIFYSLTKPTINEEGDVEMDAINTSLALQIGGRAGRYGTQFEIGEVTTFKRKDLVVLKEIVDRPIDVIEQAGLHPTADQIELFAYHLPQATLCNLIDIFMALSQLDNDSYFMCNMDDFKFLAEMIEHIPLTLRVRYVLCCSPIPKKQAFVCSMFQKFARQMHLGEPLTFDWLCRQIGTITTPKTIIDLVHLENVFDVLDLYLWLRFRFQDMFPHFDAVQATQKELDTLIQEGVQNITDLLKSTKDIAEEGPEEALVRHGVLKDSLTILDIDDSPVKKHGKVEQELLNSNILSPELLEKLKLEWTEQNKQTNKKKLIQAHKTTRRPKFKK